MEDASESKNKDIEDSALPVQADRQVRLDRWLEVISAILLSLATVASAWCAYQSARWNGAQALNFSAANGARTESVRMSSAALQYASIDIGIFVQFMAAYSDDNMELAEFLLDRFRPEMKTAVDAWIATKPRTNPDAPLSPFAMPEYTSAAQDEADRLLEIAEQKLDEAREANQRSDNYILLTVLFASVLFFGGVSTKFDTFRVRVALIALAMVIFTATFITAATYPVY